MACTWTRDENKLFESGIADFDHEAPDFFENIRKLVPNKTIQDIQQHYQLLVRDFQLIESGYYDHLLPPLISDDQNIPIMDQEENIKEKKICRWSEEEHRLFLLGVERLGRGNWAGISRYFVPTKSSTQVSSHAQKYFIKLEKQQQHQQQQQQKLEQEQMQYQQQQEIKQHQQQQMQNQLTQYQQMQQQYQQPQQHQMQYQLGCSSSYAQGDYNVVFNRNEAETTSTDQVLNATMVTPHDASGPGCSDIAPDQH